MNKKYISKFYNVSSTGDYIVQIMLVKYVDIFNIIDSSRKEIRDIAPDVKFFIKECSDEINPRYGVSLLFKIKDEISNEKTEELIKLSLRNYFSYSIHIIKLALRESWKVSAMYATVSICLLISTIYVQKIIAEPISYEVIFQSLTIGGWVLLWEAISILTFKNREHRKDIKIYKRLLKSDAMFEYLQEKNP